jgi:hypothetical protein
MLRDDERPDDLVVTVVPGVEPPAHVLHHCTEHGDGALVLADFARGRCIQWIPDPARVPAWALASPLRTVIGRFLLTRDRFLVHGAAIGTADGAVLVTAKGGSGKSTTALSCLAAGLAIAGDDFVVLEPGPAPRAHALFATAKLERDHLARFSDLAPQVVRGGPLDDPDAKAVLTLFPGFAAQLAPVLPLRAIAVPVLALERRESDFEPLRRGVALLALAPSSLFLVPGAGKETLDALRAMVAVLPVYRLRIGSDVRGIPAAIAALLAKVVADG